jgi:2-polyprenyl-6-methoxyphenol hydroxylase-like FAD-dependent oxidoreductase
MDVKKQGDYEAASPCNPIDLPQTLLEPLLVRYATLNGFQCRFDTTFIRFVQDDQTNTVITTLQDNLTGSQFHIRSKYLFGADGARSEVLKQLGLPLLTKPGGGLAINVLVRADLSRHIEHRTGNLHWLFQPDRPYPSFGWSCIARMVKPWYEWMFILFPDPEFDGRIHNNPSKEDYLQRVKELIGDDSIETEVLGVSKWYVNEIVAEEYSKGNVYVSFPSPI